MTGGVRHDGDKPSNDNLQAANDNNRAQYMRDYMKRRRQGGKTLRSLLRDGLHVVEAHAPRNDPEAQAFIAAVKGLVAPEHEKPGCKGART